MAKRPSHSKTPATRFLKMRGVAFTEHFYDYLDKGGTAVSSAAPGVPEHVVVNTLVMEDEEARPLIVLIIVQFAARGELRKSRRP